MDDRKITMTHTLRNWLQQKWHPRPAETMLRAYQATFSTMEGQLVLQDLLDRVYCQTCPSLDPQALATHNGCRSVVQDILEKIDQAQQPEKYTITTEGVYARE